MRPTRAELAISGVVREPAAQGFDGAAGWAGAATIAIAVRQQASATRVTALRGRLARLDLGARVERLELELGEAVIEGITHAKQQKERLVERSYPSAVVGARQDEVDEVRHLQERAGVRLLV